MEGIGGMTRRTFSKASVGLAVAAALPDARVGATPNNDRLDAAVKRMRNAVGNIAADVDKLYSRQPKVYVPDFPADLTELRTAYDDLLVATGHEELLKEGP